jgi:hypothetical protein
MILSQRALKGRAKIADVEVIGYDYRQLLVLQHRA